MTTYTTSTTRMTGAAVGFAAVVCAVARLLVSGDGFDRVWAEDGAVFLSDTRAYGLGSVVAEYSGYGHLVPRLLALIGSWLPLGYYALFTVLASSIVVGLLAWYVFTAAKRVTSSSVWAFIAAIALVLTPAYRAEALGNLANLQWFLMPAALWAIVDPHRTHVAAILIAAAAATTSPLSILLLPALLIIHGRTAWRTPVAAALAAGLAYQAIVRLIGMHSVANPAPRSPGAYVGMVFDILKQASSTPWAPLVAGAILIAVILSAWFIGARKDARAAAFVVTSALFVAVPTVLNGSPQPRYIACGFVILIWAACLAAPALQRIHAIVLATVLVVSALVTFPADPYRLSGPSWTSETNSACTTGTREVELSPEGWGSIRLPC
ncbi:hypothetical protein LWC34_03545 [Kibdelosporangium philippinense]|uniref:DUF2029 domain-containing protein n=1 Tax=Kibdelosporangium philippinense TaxID=211113 RepID=A0ABS8Z4M5_9PSEU|nr:hypothetical protein [Kibdelosporangium philippinense]MCE7001914.1 hypothetical protein [Kibdelosporangium philippinense]